MIRSAMEKLSGKLGNGLPLKVTAASVSKRGDYPLYASDSRSTVIGWVKFDGTPARILSGKPIWIKGSGTGGLYDGGFTNEVPVEGSIYTPPLTQPRCISITNGAVSLKDGNLLGPVTNLVTVSDANRVTVVQTNIPMKTATISRSWGVMNGTWTFAHPANPKEKMVGVYLQEQNYVGGYFLGTNQTGSIKLESTP